MGGVEADELVELVERFLGSSTVRISSWPTAGFSGAKIWQVETSGRRYCLRRWPPSHPSPERLTFIHSVLEDVSAKGGPPLPVPLRDPSGASFVCSTEGLWQLEPWMPGKADFHREPSGARLAAAMQALGRFHVAAEWFAKGWGPSPGIGQRAERAMRLKYSGGRLLESIERQAGHAMAELLREIVRCAIPRADALAARLEHAARWTVRLQPSIRDVWHDHVLFEGDVVTGLIDFGAMDYESVAADVARLLGSLVEDDAELWSAGLAAYSQVRPLSVVELEMVRVFDAANVVLAGPLWAEWIFAQHRQFPSVAAVAERLEQIRRRLLANSRPAW